MAQILSFLDRLSGGRDWTLVERARLADLADRLPGQAGVEAIFGRGDDGAPWCVVTDADGEVLVHVARIDGKVVVHDLAHDLMDEADTLWDALDRLLGAQADAAAEPGRVIPFPLDSREAKSLIALLVAAAFGSGVAAAPGAEAASYHPLEEPSQPPAPEPDDTPAPPEVGDPTAAKPPIALPEPAARTAQAALAASADQVLEPHATPAPRPVAEAPAPSSSAPPAVEPDPPPALDAPAPPSRPAGETLHGGEGADVLRGGAGHDTLDGGGAPDGRVDVLDGGAGDDRLVLHANSVALGGEGHDVFVLPAAPAAPIQDETAPAAETAATPPVLAVVLDFEFGDRLELPAGAAIVSVTEVADVTTSMPGAAEAVNGLTAMGSHTPSGFSGRQVGLDFDGDGRSDGFVMVSGHGCIPGWKAPEESPIAPEEAVRLPPISLFDVGG